MPKRPQSLEFDEIGYWSEVKLAILNEYAKPYNEILHAKRLKTAYIDAFAGAGHHVAKGTGDLIKGSPVLALEVKPPFDFLHFVDMKGTRTKELERLSSGRSNVTVYHGDANKILPEKVFPKVRYEDYRRALCVLDPYGLDLDWQIIAAAGALKSIEIFLNFPVMDMNRNVLWHDLDKVSEAQQERLTRFWGDDSWKTATYSGSGNLFNFPEKASNDQVASAFQERLKKLAGFKVVPDPIPMRNSKGAVVYYLFFASQQPVAADIVSQIFRKYQHEGER